MNDNEFTVNSQGTEWLARTIVSYPAIIHPFIQCPIRRKEIHSSNDGLQTPLRQGSCPHESCRSETAYPVSIFFCKSVQGFKNTTLELCWFGERITGFVWRETQVTYHLPGQTGRFTIQANCNQNTGLVNFVPSRLLFVQISFMHPKTIAKA